MMSSGTEECSLIEDSDDQLSVKSDDQSSVKSDDSSGSNRVKFLYSYGGRIVPRHNDGKLRYVGGETRVFAVNRNVSFADLFAKMAEVLGSSVVLKCQLPSEDLDALVSIKSDEDVENVLEEYDRLGAKEGCSSKVRAFLFPKPSGVVRPPVAGGHMVGRGCNGHIDRQSERAIVQPHDDGVYGFVASSTPSEALRPPHIHQETHFNPIVQRPRGPNPLQHHLQDAPSKAGRPPRYPHVHPDAHYNSPVRYAIRSATHIHDRVTVPHQQKYAGRAVPKAYVDDGQFTRVDHSSSARVVYSDSFNCSSSPPPPAQVQFPGKATKAPQQEPVKKAQNQFILHSPYYGVGLGGFRAQQHFLVQN